ncbi:tRNA dimethylallyltransferase [Bienertia sinuspersici]
MAAVRRLNTQWKAEMAEAYFARFGIQLAHRFGFNNIILESDSLQVVKYLQGSCENLSPVSFFSMIFCALKVCSLIFLLVM